MEHFSASFDDSLALFDADGWVEKAGRFGCGRAAASLLSIDTMFNIVGRSFGFCCTQRSPMLMYLSINAEAEAEAEEHPKDVSFMSSARFEVHSSHAC